jgi:hypothetical protein
VYPFDDLESEDHWHREQLVAREPYASLFKLRLGCRRYDVIGKMANNLAIKKRGRLTRPTEETLFALYDITADAWDRSALRPHLADIYALHAIERGRFGQHELRLLARDLGAEGRNVTPNRIAAQLTRPLIALLHRARRHAA